MSLLLAKQSPVKFVGCFITISINCYINRCHQSVEVNNQTDQSSSNMLKVLLLAKISVLCALVVRANGEFGEIIRDDFFPVHSSFFLSFQLLCPMETELSSPLNRRMVKQLPLLLFHLDRMLRFSRVRTFCSYQSRVIDCDELFLFQLTRWPCSLVYLVSMLLDFSVVS